MSRGGAFLRIPRQTSHWTRPMRRPRSCRPALALAALLALAACGGGGSDAPTPPPTPPPSPAPVATVSIAPATDTLIPGQSTTLVASARDANGAVLSGRTIAFSSGAPNTASVSNSGLVTALAPGSAIITAESEGRSASATIVVRPVPVASIIITPVTGLLVPGSTAQLSARLRAADSSELAGRTVRWSSNAPAVLAVDSLGRISAVTAGTATVRATTVRTGSDSLSASLALTVAPGGLVGTTGGTVQAGDVTLTFPAAALTAATAITVQPTAAPPSPSAVVPGTAHTFGPEGTQFAQPVTVALRWSAAALPAGTRPGHLVVHRWNGTAWLPLPNAQVDTVARVARATTTGFSTFALLPVAPVLAWQRLAGHPGESWSNDINGWAIAAGRLWVVVGEDPPIFWSTADGITWESFNPTTVGLPSRKACGSATGLCTSDGFAVIGTETELLVMMMLYHGATGAQNGAGHFGGLWAVRGRPGSWSVLGPESPGLDQAKPAASARNFRIQSLRMGAAWGARRVIVGASQWWLPFSTGDRSFHALSTGASGGWNLFGRDETPFGGSLVQTVTGLAAGPAGFHAVGTQSGAFIRWVSPDGVTWSQAADPAAGLSAVDATPGPMLFGPGGYVHARSTPGTPRERLVYRSPDGSSWEEIALGTGRTAFDEGFVSNGRYVLRDGDNALRMSSDGRTWTELPSHASRVIMGFGDRLFGFGTNAVWMLDVSGR